MMGEAAAGEPPPQSPTPPSPLPLPPPSPLPLPPPPPPATCRGWPRCRWRRRSPSGTATARDGGVERRPPGSKAQCSNGPPCRAASVVSGNSMEQCAVGVPPPLWAGDTGAWKTVGGAPRLHVAASLCSVRKLPPCSGVAGAQTAAVPEKGGGEAAEDGRGVSGRQSGRPAAHPPAAKTGKRRPRAVWPPRAHAAAVGDARATALAVAARRCRVTGGGCRRGSTAAAAALPPRRKDCRP